MKKLYTCIVCPEGCSITAEEENGCLSVSGNKCRRGEAYVRQEAFDPRRNISSTVRVNGGTRPVVSVKTSSPIPKDMIFAVMDEIRRVSVDAPVRSGQVLIANVADTNCGICATTDVEKA